jgi:hypothetical protein
MPGEAQEDGDAVQVALRDARCAEVGGHSATEHVGEAATATAVKEDQQGQQEARDPQEHLEDYRDDEYCRVVHNQTFRWLKSRTKV